MRRVVITGIGIVSSIGTDADSVTQSLREAKSGIVAAPDYKELGFRSQVKGAVDIDLTAHIDRKQMRFMGEGAAYAVVAMQQAVIDSGLTAAEISNPRTGLIAGSGGPSTANMLTAFDTTRDKGPKRVGPYMVPRCMSSTVSACIATFFEIKGVNYSISSACSTSAHCITAGTDAIRYGMQDIVFAGGGEELHWTLSVLFDAMGACHLNIMKRQSWRHGLTIQTETGLSSQAAAVWWYWRIMNMPGHVAQKFMLRLSAMALIQMAMTWWRHQAKVLSAA